MTSPKLASAMRRYRQRAQFHDEYLLQAIIDAVREEEAAKYAKSAHARRENYGDAKAVRLLERTASSIRAAIGHATPIARLLPHCGNTVHCGKTPCECACNGCLGATRT